MRLAAVARRRGRAAPAAGSTGRPARAWVTVTLRLVAVGLLAVLGGQALAQAAPRAGPAGALVWPDYRLSARALGAGVWVVEGANADFSPANGCNIINTGFVDTPAGVLVVNTGTSRLHGEQLRALVARTTGGRPVAQVLHLNLHPDYFLGNQAFADVPRRATEATRAGIAREAAAYETNLYRLCGDWMKGTETVRPDATVTPGPFTLGGRLFELLEYSGHTESDLVLVDRASGVAFAGGLVFAERIPTTPHADVRAWLASLDRLEADLARLGVKAVVPSHGPVDRGGEGIAQTRAFLRWLDTHFTRWAREGWEMNEVLRAPVPPEFRRWAAFETEWIRNVAHLYPRYERAALGSRP